jgi:hypothetical protein
MAGRCSHCDGGWLPIEGGRIDHGGSTSGEYIKCGSCNGTGWKDGGVDAPAPAAATGGFLTRLFGWVVGWVFMGFLALVALAAVIFIPRMFSTNPAGEGSGVLKPAERGMAFPANHQVGDCHVPGSWDPVPCDAAHTSQVYALVYVDAAPGSPYPAENDLVAFGRAHCRPHFSAYAAGTPTELGVYLGEAHPSEEEWNAGVRQMLCGAIGVDGTTFSAPLPLAP